TFPLSGGLDLILGLPWLKKHKPRPDWDKDAYEFTRNGRQYMLYPRKAPPKINVLDAKPSLHILESEHEPESEMLFITMDELDSFIDKKTQLFFINAKSLDEKGKKNES